MNRGVRSDYKHFTTITTRWLDNDVYGHINNVIYYAFFDTAVNEFLIAKNVLDFQNGTIIGLVVETGCRYFAPIAFPDRVWAGVRVVHIGNSSVRYEVGLFRNDDDNAVAEGYFVHVYVDRTSRQPTPLTAELRDVVETLIS